MIRNNLLSDKLNEFKNKENNLSDTVVKPSLMNLINIITGFFILLIKSIIFGYTIKIIVDTSWNFWEIICIGLSINFLLDFIQQLIHKE